MDDFTSYESDPTRFFYEVFDENGVCENKFICIETVTNTGVGTNSDQTHITIKIYSVPIYDHRHDTYIHRDDESFIGDVWFVNASKSLTNKKYSHIDICKSNFTTLIDIFKSITYVNPAEIQTLVNKKLLLHSDHHFLPPGLTETELQNFIKSNWSQIYNKDYNYEFFHSSGANSGIMREVHNVKVEKNVVTNKYRYTTAGKSKANITPSTITVDSVNHTYTGTLSSSTYSGYKLAASTNKIVSSGNHTLTGYTGNNITLGITGNTVNVTNSKTSSNRTTELQNFIKSNWSQKFWKYAYPSYDYARSLGYGMNPYFRIKNRFCQNIEVSLTRLSSPISYNNDNWGCSKITYYSENLSVAYTQNYRGRDVYSHHIFFNVDCAEYLFRVGKNLILEIRHRFSFFSEMINPANYAACIM